MACLAHPARSAVTSSEISVSAFVPTMPSTCFVVFAPGMPRTASSGSYPGLSVRCTGEPPYHVELQQESSVDSAVLEPTRQMAALTPRSGLGRSGDGDDRQVRLCAMHTVLSAASLEVATASLAAQLCPQKSTLTPLSPDWDTINAILTY